MNKHRIDKILESYETIKKIGDILEQELKYINNKNNKVIIFNKK